MWIKQDSTEWSAWTEHGLATKGKRPPIDSKEGWRFPTPEPPAIMAAGDGAVLADSRKAHGGILRRRGGL